MTDRSPAPVAVVTGAGQGLGRAFALRLAADGFAVAVADLNGERATAVAAEIIEQHGPDSALGITVDVADADSVAAMGAAVAARWGRWDALVNNAAVFSTLAMRPFTEIPLEEWNQVLAVNLTGAFLCCREAVPQMTAGGGGSIVNISSAAVLQGRPNYLHYVSSKAALLGMTRSLASEVGAASITVNAITPGSTETEIPRETVTAAQVERIIANQVIPRRQRATDLVGAVSFLCSPDSAFITGQTLNVDGGSVFL